MKDCTRLIGLVAVVSLIFVAAAAEGQEKTPGKAQAAGSPPLDISTLRDAKVQQDYPDLCLDADGTPWLVFIAHDGEADQLKLAKKTSDGLKVVGDLSERGIIHQPRLARDANDRLWAFWSELNDQNVWNLRARQIADGKIAKQAVDVAASEGNDIFCDARADRAGRVWVAWQSLRGKTGDIFARFYDPQKESWSAEFQITQTAHGEWEPRLAFARDGEAAICFDSAEDGNFDVQLATVSLDGEVQTTAVATSPSYEARSSIAAAPDGSGFWVAWERGLDRWGGDRRGHAVNTGLNAQKQIDVVFVDAKSKEITPAPNVKPLVNALAGGVGKTPAARRRASGISINLPQLFVDANGTPHLMCRYARNNGVWQLALTRLDRKATRWAKPISLPQSSFNQDRYCCGRADDAGNVWLAWPADLRTTKKPGIAAIYLAKTDAGAKWAVSETAHPPVAVGTGPRNDPARATAQRDREDRHHWQHDGKKYGLYWGDFHRHTSFSNCRTITDGCIVEQFRYALDAGYLDFLGTSDHTDIAKAYTPYEWWENQKLHDLFHVGGFFNTFYVYEREQRWPWGHRNVVFAERGAPIIYIKRATTKLRRGPKTCRPPTGRPRSRPKSFGSCSESPATE